MGWFKSIEHAFSQVIHNPVVQVVFPAVAAGNLLAEAGINKLTGLASPHPASPVQQHEIYNYQYPQQGNVPQPYAASFGGGYSAYDTQPYAGGGLPLWDYSTASAPFSTPQYPTFPVYSTPASRAGLPWEDLASLALPFL
jgi:hypothetical protein